MEEDDNRKPDMDPLGLDCCGFDDEQGLPAPTDVPEPHLLTLRDSDGHPLPFPGTYWVSFPMLLAGRYPGDQNPEKAREKCHGLMACGIGKFINLMEETERGYDRNPFASYKEVLTREVDRSSAAAREESIPERHAGIRSRAFMARFPVVDLDVPNETTMKEILDTIDTSIMNRSPVYVHCRGGIGRTGTVVGCWLARHGIATGDAALERITTLRDAAGLHGRSPETPEQFEMVRNWKVDS